ncbi:MAG: mshA 5 [Candidatus Angelobacter sp.]|jgi:glycosyltransferase involved in cell wall biosynthesis|nr:mshA 5 [Candidatus Angelobacter sp.]
MRIAFDLRRIKNPGIGRYMKCLVEAVIEQEPQHEYLLILPPDADGAISVDHRRATKLNSRLKYYSLQEQLQLPAILRRNKIGLFHSPHFMMPLLRPCPCVVTIHDVIYLACKEDLASRIGRLYYHGMMSASVRVADRVITDSEFSKQEIVRRLHADPSKIEVIYPGVARQFQHIADSSRLQAVCSKYRINDHFILYTGIYKPRKNHAGLLHSFQRFLANGGQGQLVIAGPMNEGDEELKHLAEKLGIEKQMVFAGFVDDLDLQALYSAARVYACPSLYEGFGFTVLEAMACGVPVVCSTAASLPEVAGQGALYADPRNPEEFAGALHRAFFDPEVRKLLIENGRNNCQRFSWENAAQQTLAVYHEAVSTPHPEAAYA